MLFTDTFSYHTKISRELNVTILVERYGDTIFAKSDVTKISCNYEFGKKVLKIYVLSLCLPEDCSFSLDCLRHYKGGTIIHIGELFGETLSANPWGQTTSRAFQLELGERFRCVSRVQLPNWPGHMDSLTIWSRASQPVECDGDDMVFVRLENPRYLGWNAT